MQKLEGGMQTFFTVWFGQLASLVGTAMTRFALLIWAYEQTGNATTLALLGFFSFVPFVIVSPVAGVWVDRFDRRRVMLLADLGAGLMTVTLLALFASGNLQIWHLYVAEGFAGFFEAFQIPAYTAAITTLVPKAHYARASGMRSLARWAALVLAPPAAGLLLRLVGIEAVMLFDVATFSLAMLTLALVRIPRPSPSRDGLLAHGNFRQEMRVGLGYIGRRRGLMWLVGIFAGMNFFAALTYFSILPALILARTGSDEIALASVQAALGAGGVLGGIVLGIWGGPKRKIHGIFAGAALSFALGDFFLATGRGVPVWVVAAFVSSFFIPIIAGANNALWQAKVPPDLQGRVFSVRAAIQESTTPLAFLLAGPLADRIFEPGMAAGGLLANAFGPLVGVGPGAGIALMFLATSILGAGMALSGYLLRDAREVEAALPDYREAEQAEQPAGVAA